MFINNLEPILIDDKTEMIIYKPYMFECQISHKTCYFN